MYLKTRKSVVTIISAVAFLLTVPLYAKASVSINQQIPFSGGFIDPCGSGDFVAESGNLHVVATLTTDSAGGLHGKVSFNLDNYSAVDTVTGTKYQEHENGQGLLPSGPFFFNFNNSAGGTVEFTQNIALGLEAQGSGRMFDVKIKLHMTVNANGSITATVSDTNAACK